VNEEYTISGAAADIAATMSDDRRGRTKRAILYVGKTANEISSALTSLISAYAMGAYAPNA